MIGTATLLYKATADRKYLQDAQQLADSSISFYTEHNYSKKELAFNAIFFRNLMLLNSVAPNPEYAKALESYIPQLWSIMDQQNQFLESGRAIDQGAAVQTFATEAIEKLRDATPDRKVGLK
jgi:uncharacterized protein YyaL (SSP411 family)